MTAPWIFARALGGGWGWPALTEQRARRWTGRPVGISGVTADEINRYIVQGFQAIPVGVDVGFPAASAQALLSQIRR